MWRTESVLEVGLAATDSPPPAALLHLEVQKARP